MDLDKCPSCVDIDGNSIKELRASNFLGTNVVDFTFSPAGGAGWHQETEDITPPAGARFATIAMAGWQLRVNKTGIHDMQWHDGGVIVWLHHLRSASCRALLRDDNGDEPFNGFVRALVSFYS